MKRVLASLLLLTMFACRPTPVPKPPTPPVQPPPVVVPVTPPPPPLSRGDADGPIRISGVAFYGADGFPITIRGASGFELFAMYANNMDIDTTLDDWIAQSHGKLNYVRVLGSYAGALGQFHGEGQARGNYFDVLDAFLGHMEGRNLYVEFTVFADAENWMPSPGDQQAWLARVNAVLNRHPLVLGELCNECHFNGVDPSLFTRPPGPTLWSRGSGGADEVPPGPVWDYSTDHPGRPSDWPRRVHCGGGPSDFIATMHVPCIEDEPMGASETNQPGKRDTDPSHFFEAAAASVLDASGFVFHSDSGITGQPMGPVEAACMSAAFDAMGMIAPPFQLSPYQRGGLSGSMAPQIVHDDALTSRTFSKELGTEAWDIAVLPTAAWSARAIAPWRIDKQYGPKNELVHLVR